MSTTPDTATIESVRADAVRQGCSPTITGPALAEFKAILVAAHARKLERERVAHPHAQRPASETPRELDGVDGGAA